MNDEIALHEQAVLVTKILFLCKEYAEKDGLDFMFVVKTVAEAMTKAVA